MPPKTARASVSGLIVYAYSCRIWNGTGQCGTIHRTVTNYSARINGGACQNLWPAGNTLSDFVTVYR